jgi:ubiquinone/menaquinone biosynthesis C-methylase UbiE
MSSDHFSAVALGYARYRPGYPDALFDWLADRPERRDVAWDCATGSGQGAASLAGRFRRVVATDFSASQIGNAVRRPGVEYRVAPAESSGLPDGAADLITVAQALHWFDLATFYAEARRVLAPGGAVAAWCYNLLDAGPRVNAVVGRYYSQVVGGYWPPERRLLEAGYRTVPFPFREVEAPPFEMATEWSLDHLLGYLGTWSATERYRRVRREDPLALVEGDLRAAWGEPGATRAVRWPLHLRVGLAGG